MKTTVALQSKETVAIDGRKLSLSIYASKSPHSSWILQEETAVPDLDSR